MSMTFTRVSRKTQPVMTKITDDGTPVNMKPVPLYRTTCGTAVDEPVQFGPMDDRVVGMLKNPIPLMWDDPIQNYQVGQLVWLSKPETELLAQGVLFHGTNSELIVEAITTSTSQVALRPEFDVQRCKYKRIGGVLTVVGWRLKSVLLTRDYRKRMWDFNTDTMITAYPPKRQATAVA